MVRGPQELESLPSDDRHTEKSTGRPSELMLEASK